jgi:hypothetical protein
MITWNITRTVSLLGVFITFNLFVPVNAAPKADFNADGRADVFLQNPFTKEMAVWLTNGSSVTQNVSFQGFDAPWTLIALKDFSGDGITDLLWYHKTTREYKATLFRDSSGTLPTVQYGKAEDPSAGWVSIALNDFNADGRTDLLWYNSRTGQLKVWLLSENGRQIVDYPAVDISAGWTPAAVDDFNDDDRADILWFNIMNRSLVAWFLSEGGMVGSAEYGKIPDPSSGWSTIGLGDVNADGRADLFGYNNRTGALAAALLSENGLLQTVNYPPTDPSTGWSPAAVDDFNADGRADVLWFNIVNRTFAATFLSEEGIVGGAEYGVAEDTNDGWTVNGLDDFNGDGRVDMLWRNFVNNQTKAWLLGDSGVLEAPFYGDVQPSSVWLIEVPN